MKKILLIVAGIIIVAMHNPGLAENITVNGDMGSKINFEINKKVTTVPGIQNLTLGFVVPETFTSPTYRQDVRGFDLKFTPTPTEEKSRTDDRGNRVITASWKIPPESIDVRISFETFNITRLDTINTFATFPLINIPKDVAYYLKATGQVQANDARVRDLAAELVKNVHTEFAAVQRIITFVVDYIHYVTFPEKYDAIYSLASRKGNCQNFSHLSAALMRASGIPVRIVNGVTLNKPLNITRETAMLTYKMAQGRHSWIEVWFPDLGWVPFDPQQTAMFVLNRFIRIEVGIDNDETINDGLVRWSLTGIRQGDLKIREVIHADFIDDKVVLKGRHEVTGPKSYLLFPLMTVDAKNEVTPPLPSATPLPTMRAEVKKVEVAPPLPSPTMRVETKNVATPPLPSATPLPTMRAEVKKVEVAPPLPSPTMRVETKNVEATPPLPSATPAPTMKAEVKNVKVAQSLPSPIPSPSSNTREEGIFSNIWRTINKAFGRTAEAALTMPSFFSNIKEKTRIAFKAEKGSIEEVPLSDEGLVTLGNLEFPAEIDFAFPPDPVVTTGENSFEKTRSFFVETAEFVTSMRTQYAQVFAIEKALKLESIGLALHKFGGDGHLWIDVYQDDGGKPGKILATSDMVDLDNLSEKPGYRWTDFSFSGNKPALAVGNYWIALGFTGSPIVNWFYTYGKPVGPSDGTRYKGIYDKDWSGAMNYEFNYRVAGVVVK